MIDPKRIEDFIKKCCDAMPTNVTSIKKELAHNLQLFLQSTFDELNIVTREEFDVLIKKNNFYEFANIFDNNYGTHKETVIKLLSQGKDVLFDIDWQGTLQLKKITNLNIVCIFILPPNINILRDRLLNRHKGQEKLIEKRMNKFNEEISHWNEYNYVLVNDDLETCYKTILNIMLSEKKGISKKQNLEQIKEKVKELI